ncbi:hypothetical protein Pla111_32280 [Botrimarina hoheduenensis]|uniref:Helix-turn-helix domain protein n=1 Tax=Botrimarina hoheduenensis TaxID=2528000 RepID=A0A5C5VRJ8_9BACT|nr:hypothetical protein Pla111_32280 [Botrimarina hoheduenensis]
MPMRRAPRMGIEGPSGPFKGSVSLAAAAASWGVPRRAVRRLVASGRVPFVQIAGRIRLPRKLVEHSWEWVAARP